MVELTNLNPKEEMEFTNKWFDINAKGIWDQLLPQIKPKKILEIGSFEGRSLCHIIVNNNWCDNIELHCIDTWEGGIEHQSRDLNLSDVEKRFDKNISIATHSSSIGASVHKHKGTSISKLASLIADEGAGTFDFIYVDGSHQAPDVISDAILGFNLLKVGGVIGFDDYLWSEALPYGKDPLRMPKFAIDSFINIYIRKLDFIKTGNQQLYVQKKSE